MLHVILYCRIALPTRISDSVAQSVTSRAVDYKAAGSNLGRPPFIFCVETMSHLSFSTLQIMQIAHNSLVQPLFLFCTRTQRPQSDGITLLLFQHTHVQCTCMCSCR